MLCLASTTRAAPPPPCGRPFCPWPRKICCCACRLHKQQQHVTRAIESRAAELLGFISTHVEPVQIVHYTKGQFLISITMQGVSAERGYFAVIIMLTVTFVAAH